MCLGNIKNVIRQASYTLVTLSCNRNEWPSSCLNFLDVGDNFLIYGIARSNRHGWEVLINQCQRTMFHLARSISFCVHIRKFFQFKRSFERNGQIEFPTQIEKIMEV